MFGSVYLKPVRTDDSFNIDDYNYQDELISFHTGDERYLKNSGDVAVSYANNIIIEGGINGTPASYLKKNIVSIVQTKIDEIGTSGGGMFQIYGESKYINSTFNNGHCFSFGPSVTSIHDLKIIGDCILNKVYIDVKPTVTYSRIDGVVIEVWYRPSDTTLLLYPDLMNESISTINISSSQTTNSWYDITGKSFLCWRYTTDNSCFGS